MLVDGTNAVESSLSSSEIQRYGRQMILDEIGLRGQERIRNSKVLIVGAGGLGCPSSQYLVGAGVGTLGLVDNDTVDSSNLHRQILHSESTVGQHKVDSAIASLRSLNSSVTLIPHRTYLSPSNALALLRPYDLVLDCSDNAPTRYLVNDSCVLLGIPLVSGAALRDEGQVSTFNHDGGPCYRCIHPSPPSPGMTPSCAEAGVLGPVTGMVGAIQATEALKILATGQAAYSGRLLLVSPWIGVMRSVKLRPRRKECEVCGVDPRITQPESVVVGCEAPTPVSDRITTKELHSSTYSLIIDVRPAVEFRICALQRSKNCPIGPLLRGKSDISESLREVQPGESVFVVCRKGNDSQRAVGWLRGEFPEIRFRDVVGGLEEWSRTVDPSFPVY